MDSEQSISDEMFAAVREGKEDKVKELMIRYGLSYSSDWDEGYTLLLEALTFKQINVIKPLLRRACKVHNKNENFTNSAVQLAFSLGDMEIFEYIFKQVVCKNARYGILLLKNAFEENKKDVIRMLIKCGANVDIVYSNGKTLLHYAVEEGCNEIIGSLLSYGADPNVVCTSLNEAGYTSLHFAVSNMCVRPKKWFFKNVNSHCNDDDNSDFDHSFYKYKEGANRSSNLKIGKLLLDKGADVDCKAEDNTTPLHLAIGYNNESFAKLLLKYGAKVDNEDKNGKTELYLAVEKRREFNTVMVEHILNYARRNSYEYIAESLLNYGFTIEPGDKNNAELLHGAIRIGYLDFVEDLLKYGTNANLINNLGYTPLHTAAKNKHNKVIELLIRYGADVNGKGEFGKTPIFITVEAGDLETTKFLLSHKANIQIYPELLTIAVNVHSKEVVEILLKNNINVNAIDKDGKTALHLVAYGFGLQEFYDIIKTEIAEVLLENGANVNAQDKWGCTALYYASHNGYVPLVKTLLYYDADVNITCKNENILLKIPMFSNRILNIINYNNLKDIFKRHIIQMKVANFYLNTYNTTIVAKLNKQEIDFQNKCIEEINRMKREQIENSSISFYKILAENTNKLVNYINNDKIFQALKSGDYKYQFPIYARMIENNFIKGMKRKNLLDQSKSYFHFVFMHFHELPRYCTTKILNYLSDQDLQHLINANTNI